MRLTLLLILILYNGMLLDNPLLFSMLEVSLRGGEACPAPGCLGRRHRHPLTVATS